MIDSLLFAVESTADSKYLNLPNPVTSLPQGLRRRPSAMSVQLIPETAEAKHRSQHSWVSYFLLPLVT